MTTNNVSTSDVTVELTTDDMTSVVKRTLVKAVKTNPDDPFLICNIGDVINKYLQWMKELPHVKPHYAVKANDDPVVVSILSQLGVGFDCASKAEIDVVLDKGVDPSHIIYAHPTKHISYIQHAARCGIYKMTFDNGDELLKIREHFPNAELVLRLMPPDDSKSEFPLSKKFGCSLDKGLSLLRLARQLELKVIGISFHVGSNSYDPAAFSDSVAEAKLLFMMAHKEGFTFDLLDIGGGFPGESDPLVSFQDICSSLRPALEQHFPANSGVTIIAEPGNFFVGSAFNLAVPVIARRVELPDDEAELAPPLIQNPGSAPEMVPRSSECQFKYYLSDGVYGSFHDVLHGRKFEVKPLKIADDVHNYKSVLWGPTCDAIDCIRDSVDLPELQIGDWLTFPDMGAYTTVLSTRFNGMTAPRTYYVSNPDQWSFIAKLKKKMDKQLLSIELEEDLTYPNRILNNYVGSC